MNKDFTTSLRTAPVMFRCLIGLAALSGYLTLISADTHCLHAAEIDFLRDIEPILKRNCYRCHAGEHQEAGLLLDRVGGLIGTADSAEPIVAPHRPDNSLLFQRVTDDHVGDVMPLDGKPLDTASIELIRVWIELGAVLPEDWKPGEHWAYLAAQTPAIPDLDENVSAITRNPIDHFIAAKLARESLSISAVAEPATLARRVSLALTGLPATPQQLRRLQQQPTNAAYEALVDELLAAPTFGQHWARHWLDLARYADSNGFQADQLRDAWAYRDWVVDALNADMPFDQFVIEQLAGDLLPDANDSNRIATGFHRTPTCNVEAGVHPEANRVNQVFDRVNTTATVFLGTTLECAQCHDHKYDPFTQTDYYQMFAYFNNTPLEVKQTAGVTYDFVGPKMSLPMTAGDASELEMLQLQLSKLKEQRAGLSDERDFESWLTATKQSLLEDRAKWVTPQPRFHLNTQETSSIQEDQSVLLGGDLPTRSVCRFEYELDATEHSGAILGVRIDALRDPSLPGGGPGRGDEERTNFVLHELTATIQTLDGDHRNVVLGDAKASFSQAGYDVTRAIDSDTKTGWAVAPQFKKEHWAEFRTIEPPLVSEQQTLAITLVQNYGSGRVMGRPKVSLLIGSPLSVNLNDEIIELIQQPKPLNKKQRQQLQDFYADSAPKAAELDREIKNVQTAIQRIEPPTTLVMTEMDAARETFIMQRGDYLAKGDTVSAGTPKSLHPLDEALPKNRLGLAKWITDPDNPLLSRVTVNRFWMQLFGRGIVTTPEDFGTQSEPPSHPDLLDWLSLEFQNNGWSVKQLLKTIVMSATFRQDSRLTSELLECDPDNVLLARGPRFRLPAEMIRDNALAISGLLSMKAGGPPVMPYQPDGIWRAVGRNQPKWQAAEDEHRYRRGIYVVWKRSAPYPSFVTFDAPDRASCTVRRPQTNTPLQALVLLNDQAYAEAAMALATRMIRESPSSDPAAIVNTGYTLATAQTAEKDVMNILVDLYEREHESMIANPVAAKARCEVLPVSFQKSNGQTTELAAWYAVASVLLNLDVTITFH
jgi:hypothetical protein